jgi:hypothetical protein
LERLPKARPSGARLKLGIRGEKRHITTDTVIGSLIMVVPILSGKSVFRALFLGDVVLESGKQLLVILLVHRHPLELSFYGSGNLLVSGLNSISNGKVGQLHARRG